VTLVAFFQRKPEALAFLHSRPAWLGLTLRHDPQRRGWIVEFPSKESPREEDETDEA
jgi:hypothetical protein